MEKALFDKPKILIVDDEPRMCQSLMELLAGHNYELNTANSAKEAIEYLNKNYFDLILLNIGLPDMDGFQVMDHINRQSPKTLIIVMTGHTSMESAVKALRKGAYDYLRKPFEPEKLLTTVKIALNQQKVKKDGELAKEALRESEERFRSIVENTNAGYFFIDRDGLIQDVNESWIKMYGYSSFDEIVGKHFTIIQKMEDVESAKAFVKGIMRKDHKYMTGEFRRKCKDGSIGYHTFSARPVSHFGEVIGIEGFIIDSTDRKLLEKSLQISKKEWESTFDAMSDWVSVIDLDHRILRSNRSGEKFLSIPLGEMIGQTCYNLVHGSEEPIPECPLQKMLQTHERETIDLYVQEMNRWLRISIDPIMDEDGNLTKAVHIVRDITEYKKMEAEVLKAKKLESLGTLAGGIAHDFNNLLSAIVGNIDLAKDKIKHDRGVFDNLNEVEKASMRASDLAAQLITFSKGGKPIKKVASIGELVKNAVSATLSGSGINCEFSIPDDLFPVEIDALQIKQVIRNIVINATEAMNGKGTINVYCENAAVGEKDRLPLKAEKYVLLSIKDQGFGIAAENLSKIFDPYFSTKEMGPDKGQGLGLATCYSIIDKHDGFITAESEVAVGTTLFVYLPASEKKIEELEPVQKPVSEKPVVGRGKILVMDDERMLRNLIEQMLSPFGYDVALAQDGTEAVELYRSAMESGKPFDAVILDLTVKSGMGGKTAVQKLLKIDPHVKAIVSSGYHNDSVMTDFKKYGFTATLAKPYSMKALKDTLSKVLMGKSADH